GNALTAVVYGLHHNSVGASTAMFGAIGILAATRVVSSGRRQAARKRWMVAWHEPRRGPPRASVRPLARQRPGLGRRRRAASVSAAAGTVGARWGRAGVGHRRLATRPLLRRCPPSIPLSALLKLGLHLRLTPPRSIACGASRAGRG